jgi:hypothetical protein
MRGYFLHLIASVWHSKKSKGWLPRITSCNYMSMYSTCSFFVRILAGWTCSRLLEKKRAVHYLPDCVIEVNPLLAQVDEILVIHCKTLKFMSHASYKCLPTLFCLRMVLKCKNGSNIIIFFLGGKVRRRPKYAISSGGLPSLSPLWRTLKSACILYCFLQVVKNSAN